MVLCIYQAYLEQTPEVRVQQVDLMAIYPVEVIVIIHESLL